MAIQIDDSALEARLTDLGQLQGVRTTKTRMALSILERALARCDASGDPEAWRVTAPAVNNGSAATPSIHDATANSPAEKPVSDSLDQVSEALPSPADPATPAGEQPPSAISSPGPGNSDPPLPGP